MNTPISLRPWQPQDAPRLAQLLGNPHVYRYLSPALPRPYNLQHAREFITFCHQSHAQEYAITAQGSPIGGIGARLGQGSADIGYWLGEPYWRQGIMKQALSLFLKTLQATAPPLQRITAQTYDFNRASQALLLASGFRQTNETALLPACDGLNHPVITYLLDLKQVASLP